MVGAKVGAFPLQYQPLNPIYYHTTTKTRPIHVCARARMRMLGVIYIYGSMVVDRYKALKSKAKSHYFCHYHATTMATAMVVDMLNPLKLLETNKILGVYHV